MYRYLGPHLGYLIIFNHPGTGTFIIDSGIFKKILKKIKHIFDNLLLLGIYYLCSKQQSTGNYEYIHCDNVHMSL